MAATVCSFGMETGNGRPLCNPTCFRKSRMASVVDIPISEKMLSADFFSVGSDSLISAALFHRSTNNSAHTNPADWICSRKLEYFNTSAAARSFSAAASGMSKR